MQPLDEQLLDQSVGFEDQDASASHGAIARAGR
jgi:hypothetical protein